MARADGWLIERATSAGVMGMVVDLLGRKVEWVLRDRIVKSMRLYADVKKIGRWEMKVCWAIRPPHQVGTPTPAMHAAGFGVRCTILRLYFDCAVAACDLLSLPHM